MAQQPLSREAAEQAVHALERCGGNQSDAARLLGINRITFIGHLRRAAQYGIIPRGLPVDAQPPEGFVIRSRNARYDGKGNLRAQTIKTELDSGEVFETPKGHVVKGISAFVDPDGRVIAQWVKTREGYDPLDILEVIKKAFDGLDSPYQTVELKEPCATELLTLYPWGDWHLGMHAWHRETGQNWDLKIAVNVIGTAAAHVLARSPASRFGILLGGGDLLHADNNLNRTEKSGNPLDVDGRHAKVLEATQMLKVRTIELALEKHEIVIVRELPGNHDPYSSLCIAHFLSAWFRSEPRVIVDTDPSVYWWHRFGSVLLGATHGHTVKIENMPEIMATRRAKDWGATEHRYAHGFHLHHSRKIGGEGGGCICEVHQAPIPQDSFHFASGFLSGRSLSSITYDARYGEISRSRVAILDGAK